MRYSNEVFVNLDANATEPLRPEAQAALIEAAQLHGNPASPHRAGRIARARLEQARAQIADLFGAASEDLVFTSGATEANALALHGAAPRPVLVGATEHESVLAAAAGLAAAEGLAAAGGAGRIPVDADGRFGLDQLERLLIEAGRPALVCLMLANNETGVIHPIAEAAALCRRHGAWLHVDAAQAAGRIPLDLAATGADSIALSSHKLGGPMGAGALLLGPRRAGPLAPLIAGGGQERGRRGGTQALPAIAGFAAAAVRACDTLAERAERHLRLRARIEQAARDCGAIVCGAAAPRLPNTICLARPGRRAELQLIAMDLAGYGVSAGSACSSGKVARSHVLEAMGFGAAAGEAIRVSLPWNVAAADIDGFIAAYKAAGAEARRA